MNRRTAGQMDRQNRVIPIGVYPQTLFAGGGGITKYINEKTYRGT